MISKLSMACVMAILTTSFQSSARSMADEPADETRVESDANGEFSFKVGKAWERTDPKNDGDGTVLDVCVRKRRLQFAWIDVSRDAGTDLDRRAKDIVDHAKKKSPDLNKDCSVRTIKLDGEDARIIEESEPLAHYTSYLVKHNGHMYHIECMSRDESHDEMEKMIKEVMDSFAWTKPKNK